MEGNKIDHFPETLALAPELDDLKIGDNTLVYHSRQIQDITMSCLARACPTSFLHKEEGLSSRQTEYESYEVTKFPLPPI